MKRTLLKIVLFGAVLIWGGFIAVTINDDDHLVDW